MLAPEGADSPPGSAGPVCSIGNFPNNLVNQPIQMQRNPPRDPFFLFFFFFLILQKSRSMPTANAESLHRLRIHPNDSVLIWTILMLPLGLF